MDAKLPQARARRVVHRMSRVHWRRLHVDAARTFAKSANESVVRTLDAYGTLEKLLAEGRIGAIGVSNVMPDHLDRLLRRATAVPAANQGELQPYFQQTALQRVHKERGFRALSLEKVAPPV